MKIWLMSVWCFPLVVFLSIDAMFMQNSDGKLGKKIKTPSAEILFERLENINVSGQKVGVGDLLKNMGMLEQCANKSISPMEIILALESKLHGYLATVKPVDPHHVQANSNFETMLLMIVKLKPHILKQFFQDYPETWQSVSKMLAAQE